MSHLMARATLLLTALVGLLACTPPTVPPRGEGSAGPPAASEQRPELASVLIRGVPHVTQRPDFSGEAAVASWGQALGLALSQEDVFDASKMPPARGMGTTTRELRHAARALGFNPGRTWHDVAAQKPGELDSIFSELHADLQKNVPSVVCMRKDDHPSADEHFRLVLGYDAQDDAVIFHDSALRDGAYQRMSRRQFLSRWPLRAQRNRWTAIRLRLDGKPSAAPKLGPNHRPAEFAQHVRKLRQTLPQGFSLRVEPPFVVVGDGGDQAVQRSTTHTVRWAVSRLRRDFFSRPPKRILNVWLFKDAQSYQRNAKKLFGEKPDTPYGYYSSTDGALVMNISTGGGTLVHEIVHPYIESNFPNCPAWFNEGLGSLYEQSADRDGHIVGLTNWRLRGLQAAIKRGRIPSFHQLTHTTTGEFYRDDFGTNYAQSRYLLYYLQERGLLRRYYRAFLADQKRDPTGYRTLQRVLGEKDMRAFQQRWERFVMGLRFRTG